MLKSSQPIELNQNSTVLLCCVKNISCNIITHEILHGLFSKQGQVNKILIFEKSKVWKAFVQMNTVEEAKNAKNNLTNYVLFQDGSSMIVHFSTLKEIKLSKWSTGGIDYSIIEQQTNNHTSFSSSQQKDQKQNSNHLNLNQSDINSQISITTKTTTPTHALKNINAQPFILIQNNITPYNIHHQQPQQQQQNQLNVNFIMQEKDLSLAMPEQSSSFQQLTLQKQQQNQLQNQIRYKPTNLQQQQMLLIQMKQQQHYSQGYAQAAYSQNNQTQDILQLLAQKQSQQKTNHMHQMFPMNPQYYHGNNATFSTTNDASAQQIVLTSQMASKQRTSNMQDQLNLIHKLYQQKQNYGFGSELNARQQLNFVPPILQQQVAQQQWQKQNQLFQITHNTNEDENSITNNLQLQYHNCYNNLFKPTILQQLEGSDQEIALPQFHQPSQIVSKLKRPDPIQKNNQLFEQFGNHNKDIKLDSQIKHLFILENQNTQSIYVKGLALSNVTAKELVNLFGNFGNVEKVQFMQGQKQAILLQFQTIEQATQAKYFLNNKSFKNQKMSIFFSNYNTLDEREQMHRKKDKFKEDSSAELKVQVSPQQHRFKTGKPLNLHSLNPPSQTIYVSNLASHACTLEVISSLFAQFGTIQTIKLVPDKNMCLVKFENMQEAFLAMACVHNEILLGKIIKLSFTRIKL